jgi:Flp pilus assembly pilin Flp
MVTDVVLRMLTKVQSLRSSGADERGQTLAEYSLIISAIAVAAVVTAVMVFRAELAATFNSVTDCLNGTSC